MIRFIVIIQRIIFFYIYSNYFISKFDFCECDCELISNLSSVVKLTTVLYFLLFFVNESLDFIFK